MIIPLVFAALKSKQILNLNLSPRLGPIVVDTIYQRKGIGTLLIKKAKAKAVSLGYTKLYLIAINQELAKFYSRFDWKIIDKDKYESGITYVTEVIL